MNVKKRKVELDSRMSILMFRSASSTKGKAYSNVDFKLIFCTEEVDVLKVIVEGVNEMYCKRDLFANFFFKYI